MRDERGMVLPLTLMIMVALASLTMALLTIGGFEPLISRNLADMTQARFAAEAGVEWAYDVLASTKDWNALLVNADPNSGVPLTVNPAARPIGALPAARGTFTVRLRNDTLPGDPAITGVAVDPSATVDVNKAVIVTSTGNVNGANKTIRVAIKRLAFPPGFFPAALSFPGNEAEANFNGNAFEINGNGFHMDGTPDAGCAPALGIAVSKVLPTANPGGSEGVVEGALSAQQKDNVMGKKQDPAGQAFGNNTVAPDPTLTPEYIQNFIDQAKSFADITLNSTQANPLTYNNIGATCTGNEAQDAANNLCWGSKNPTTGEIYPKIVYIKGEPDPTSMFHALDLGGHTTGYGILIVEDGDFLAHGVFNWNGPIIVTGKWVGIGFMGGGNQSVYGAVISNETASDPGFKEGVLTGNSSIRYSCEALNMSLTSRKLTSIASWKDLAPGE